ncbi:aminoglycoside 6-adenylyltransferase [Clostridium estertheticum]|uniref:Aminoglycoside 6-adenylyltransferase n=1 Tax=Clostridium estertheticum TaxID=238834 RepID=A0AA47EKH2_9CLOT|nr:aminoglycoside 6-adenylyltransferase [Clostridium estertheticum]MBU3153612.1 aminoglycoside 6-adenylyltransferase [Clostridium estertheticum]MBU3200707.1 aminoglycoside 6-adenylyltransferase [Clostridium estertheticum]WAG61009.1 aminoglycoside 6-adenylyltransferase [Clostridium estertheticum]WAG64834.1 aminoglycoside 6-adenylyltransferase [Clostridium estertheticum]
MRSEEEVLKQILEFASNEEKVRAVILNGSRLNINVPKDIMQDYDVVFFIKGTEDISYKTNQSWIKQFGNLVILQQNNFDDGSYIFLMQFKDGLRIDLCFKAIEKIRVVVGEDSLSKILLDKDNLTDKIPEPNDSRYFVRKPTEKEWDSLINNLWWIQTYVAKGIWRDELPYVKYMYDVIFMDGIRKLLSWHIGSQYDWQVNVGKCGKWFNRFMKKDLYDEFISIYSGIDYYDIWIKLFKAEELIRTIGMELSNMLGYKYPMEYDINVSEFIRKIKALQNEAQSFDD